jgi:hypothetical protein
LKKYGLTAASVGLPPDRTSSTNKPKPDFLGLLVIPQILDYGKPGSDSPEKKLQDAQDPRLQKRSLHQNTMAE